ncbi:MAG TPA: LamG domain-containing protein, partial [Candidatus Tectomicrobia bacterium]
MNAPKYLGLERGLVGFWSFDGKDMSGVHAYDKSGNGNRGELTGGPVRSSGKLGQALSFDGSNDYVDMGVGARALLDNLPQITVSAWIKASGAISDRAVVDAATCTGAQGGGIFQLFVGYPSAGTAGFEIYPDDQVSQVAGESTVQVTDNQWHLLTGVYSGLQVAIYVDGRKENAATIGAVLLEPDTTASVEVGGHCNGTAGHEFPGTIDDVRIYNRALSADEIKRLYKIGGTAKINTSIPGPTNGLVGYW